MIGFVPARGGSKGIPAKNLQLVDNAPLVIHACRILERAGVRDIRVSTDDHDIAAVASAYGYHVEHRDTLADDTASVDDLVRYWRQAHDDMLVVVQPTVPQLDPITLAEAITEADVSDMGIALTTPAPHIYWQNGAMLTPRAQRQDADPIHREIGARVYPAGVSTIGYHYDAGDVIDIDTPSDLAAVRAAMDRRRIVIRYAANAQIGTGHYHRARMLGSLLAHHEVSYAPTSDTPKEWWLYPLYAFGKVSVVINDTLDTTTTDMLELRQYADRVVTLEDLGSGRAFADKTINALYEDGHRWADVRAEFRTDRFEVRDKPERVMVSFGGTDPARLTERIAAMDFGVKTAVVVPPGRRPDGVAGWDWVEWIERPRMAEEMLRSDVLICSAGRTVFEAATLGIPTVVLAQNEREARHRMLNDGNIYLGIGSLVPDAIIGVAVMRLLADVELRRDLSRRRIDGLGALRIVHEVEGLLL